MGDPAGGGEQQAGADEAVGEGGGPVHQYGRLGEAAVGFGEQGAGLVVGAVGEGFDGPFEGEGEVPAGVDDGVSWPVEGGQLSPGAARVTQVASGGVQRVGQPWRGRGGGWHPGW